MWVELTAKITLRDVDPRLINEPYNLNVIGGPHILNTLEGAFRDEAGATSGFRTPSNGFMLDVTDCGIRVGRSI